MTRHYESWCNVCRDNTWHTEGDGCQVCTCKAEYNAWLEELDDLGEYDRDCDDE